MFFIVLIGEIASLIIKVKNELSEPYDRAIVYYQKGEDIKKRITTGAEESVEISEETTFKFFASVFSCDQVEVKSETFAITTGTVFKPFIMKNEDISIKCPQPYEIKIALAAMPEELSIYYVIEGETEHHNPTDQIPHIDLDFDSPKKINLYFSSESCTDRLIGTYTAARDCELVIVRSSELPDECLPDRILCYDLGNVNINIKIYYVEEGTTEYHEVKNKEHIINKNIQLYAKGKYCEEYKPYLEVQIPSFSKKCLELPVLNDVFDESCINPTTYLYVVRADSFTDPKIKIYKGRGQEEEIFQADKTFPESHKGFFSREYYFYSEYCHSFSTSQTLIRKIDSTLTQTKIEITVNDIPEECRPKNEVCIDVQILPDFSFKYASVDSDTEDIEVTENGKITITREQPFTFEGFIYRKECPEKTQSVYLESSPRIMYCSSLTSDDVELSTCDKGKGGNGLSAGAIAGIVIAVVVVVGAAVGVCVWYFVFHKKKVGLSSSGQG